jgi:uncharacterized protein involved in outer membrane biogenesis
VLDVQVSVDAKKLRAEKFPALESLRFSAGLENGILKVQSIHLGLAGGQTEGWLTLDSRQHPAVVHVKLEFLGVRLERLFAKLVDLPFSAGSVAARLELKGRGGSVATLLGAASGTLALGMDGGRISNLMDAKLGLNFGKILRLMMGGDKSIGINSAEVNFDFDQGTGTLRDSFLDTQQTRVVGTGRINLRDETLELVLTPHPKKPGLFSLKDSTINIDGSFAHPQVAVVKSGSKAR